MRILILFVDCNFRGMYRTVPAVFTIIYIVVSNCQRFALIFRVSVVGCLDYGIHLSGFQIHFLRLDNWIRLVSNCKLIPTSPIRYKILF